MVKPSLRLVVVATGAAVLGAILGTAIYAELLRDSGDTRGTVVRLRPGESRDLAEEPLCVTAQKFCLIRLPSGELDALYTYDTHEWSRFRNCAVEWLAEFRFRDPATDEDVSGWFRSGCSGTTYRLTGEYVFGPGARDMDRFPVRMVTEEVPGPDGQTLTLEYVEVDTRNLICGVPQPAAPGDCERAPLPQ